MSARNIKILVTILGTLLSTVPVLAYRNATTPAAENHSTASLIMSNTECEPASDPVRP